MGTTSPDAPPRPPLVVLAVPTFLLQPALAALVSWFQKACLSTSTFQMYVVLLTWKSDESALSASTWLLIQLKLSSVSLFFQIWFLWSSSVWLPSLHSQKTTKSSELWRETGLQIMQTWSWRATSSSSSPLATGPSQNRLQIVRYRSQLLLWLIPCLRLRSSDCLHTFQTTSFFCRHTDTSHPPC